MVWNVYNFDCNCKKIVVYNALAGYDNKIKELKDESADKELFGQCLKTMMMSRYWCRCEYEVVVKAWIGGDGSEEKKIDIFGQLNLNWDRFVDYCWDNC